MSQESAAAPPGKKANLGCELMCKLFAGESVPGATAVKRIAFQNKPSFFTDLHAEKPLDLTEPFILSGYDALDCEAAKKETFLAVVKQFQDRYLAAEQYTRSGRARKTHEALAPITERLAKIFEGADILKGSGEGVRAC